jgi:signal transduction histidine kinase
LTARPCYNLEERIDTQTEIGIYRVIQELFSNILKHSQAKHVTVQLNKIEGSLQITIEDDGVGFNYQEKIKSPGMGLKNISLRVEQLQGTFHIDSEPGRGSVSIVEIPLKTEELQSLSELR